LAAARRPATGARAPRAAKLLVGALGVVSLGAALLYHGVAAPQPWDERVPVRPVSESYRSAAVPRVLGYLRGRTRAGDELFVARQEPLLYFVTGTRNPTRYEGMMQGLRERQEAEVIEALSRLRYVVMSEIDGPATGFYARELPAVQAYLERHFRIPADFELDRDQWIVVYERGEDRGEPLLDLYDAEPSGRFWVKGPSATQEGFPADELPVAGVRHLRRPLPVPVGPRGGGVDFPLSVPAGASRFEADLGIYALHTTLGAFTPRWGGTYRVSVLHEGRADLLAEAWVPDDPRGKATWQPIAADLSPWAGQRVVLRLEVVPAKERRRLLFGFWGSPRIVASAPGPGAAPSPQVAAPAADATDTP
jgi:hypothetical protein